MRNESLGIVIPAYNPDISVLIEYINTIKNTIAPEEFRIEIDAPMQEHLDRLKETSIDINVSNSRRGKGGAIMDGFDSLETDILAFADADGSVPADSLKNVIQQIEQRSADLSIASRRHPNSQIKTHQTIIRRTLGNVFAYIAQKMLPTHCRDYQCGAKAVKQNAWLEIGHHCYESGFAWDLEFVNVAGALGYDIIEVPVIWEDHPKSTVRPISTSIELATALVDVKRRTKAIAESPRFRNVKTTGHSELTASNEHD